MEQAARSGKQNIVEGVGQTETSKSGEIKLLGVAKASLDELLADYEDFLRKNNLPIWPKVDQRVLRFRKIGYDLSSLGNLSGLGNLRHKPILPIEPVDAANFLLTLCHMETYLLDRQILAAKDRLVKEGGVNENLLKKRLEYRKMKLNSPYSSNG
jgi:four helix bundle suffix protein